MLFQIDGSKNLFNAETIGLMKNIYVCISLVNKNIFWDYLYSEFGHLTENWSIDELVKKSRNIAYVQMVNDGKE